MRITKSPSVLKTIFPKYVWNIKTHEKVLYLTFDDGPTPKITEQVLDILDQYNAKATFFCIGKNVQEYPSIFKRLLQEGHTIGNHSFNHLKGWKSKNSIYLQDIRKAEEIIDSKLFRPPYGRIKPSQARHLQTLGYQIVLWDVLSYDWDHTVSKEKVLQTITKNSQPGSIIVFHDSVKAEENMRYALPKVLEYFSEKGFRFENLDVLLNQAY